MPGTAQHLEAVPRPAAGRARRPAGSAAAPPAGRAQRSMGRTRCQRKAIKSGRGLTKAAAAGAKGCAPAPAGASRAGCRRGASKAPHGGAGASRRTSSMRSAGAGAARLEVVSSTPGGSADRGCGPRGRNLPAERSYKVADCCSGRWRAPMCLNLACSMSMASSARLLLALRRAPCIASRLL